MNHGSFVRLTVAAGIFIASGLMPVPARSQPDVVPKPALGATPAATAHQTSVSVPALRRIDLETDAPMRIITRRELAQLGELGLGEALQRMPFMGRSAPNLNSNVAGDGSVIADIGALGSARCVVMLNGQRLPVNEMLGSPAVDLDAIPVSSVDRIEILLGGASPEWGADAVAGVINVITRHEASGMELTATRARTSRGDGAQSRAALFAGQVFSRGHVNITGEYRRDAPIYAASRAFSARNEALGCLEAPDCVWPFGSPITPSGVFVVPAGNALGVAPGRYTFDAPGKWRAFRATGPQNDLYSTAGDSFLRAGRSGGSVALTAGYDSSDSTQWSLDVLAAQDRIHRQLAPLPLSNVGSVADVLQTPIYSAVANLSNQIAAASPVVSALSFYNPLGVPLQDVSRRLVELGPRSIYDDNDLLFASTTLHHTVDRWDLEASLSWGRSGITEHISDVVRNDRLARALGPSGPDVSGQIRCGMPDPGTGVVPAPLADCVPLDLFGGPGTITPAMLNYITSPAVNEVQVSGMQGSLIARRELDFGSGAAPARLAIGLESRHLSESSQFAVAESGGGAGPKGGSIDRHDLLTELVWPWQGGANGGALSTFTTGTRVSWAGSESPVGSAFAAVAWRPSAEILVRSRLTQVYRAPSAGELFVGLQERTVPLGNPCVNTSRLAGFCAGTLGVAAGASSAITDSQYYVGGNPNLRPERGWGASAGLVWNPVSQPEAFAGLDLTWVRLTDSIRAPGALELVAACRDRSIADACSRVASAAGGDLFSIDGSLMNGGVTESARVDLEARDGWTTRWGSWHLQLLAGYLLRRQLIDISGERINLRGTFDVTQSATGTAYPILQSSGHLSWSRGPWSAEWSIQYIGSYWELGDRYGLLPADTRRQVGGVIYHDLNIAWAFRPGSALRLGVENLLDRAPPRINNGLEDNTDAASYRIEGRVFSLGIEFSP